MNAIKRFSGDYRFLSNFYSSIVTLDGSYYATVEHAFQAAKTIHISERVAIYVADTPGEAKRLGRKVTLRPDWEETKVSMMLGLLFQKFSDPVLKIRLLATGDAELVEGNTWKDVFWGVCNGVGNNQLGKLLMLVRASIR